MKEIRILISGHDPDEHQMEDIEDDLGRVLRDHLNKHDFTLTTFETSPSEA